jgi:hypothetical protein
MWATGQDIYNEPTDKHQYLSPQNCQPKQCTKSIPYSQALRIKRICSNEQTTKKNGFTVLGLLVWLSSADERCWINYWAQDGMWWQMALCCSCSFLYFGWGLSIPLQKFSSTHTGEELIIFCNANCKTKNIIYLLECAICGLQYIEETKQQLSKRLNSHRSDANCKSYIVSNHIFDTDHCRQIEGRCQLSPRYLSNFWVSWMPRRVVLWRFCTILGVFVWRKEREQQSVICHHIPSCAQ